MKEKERGKMRQKKKERKNETEKKERKGVKKKVPMRELNPRPLNLQPAGHHYHIATASGIDCTY